MQRGLGRKDRWYGCRLTRSTQTVVGGPGPYYSMAEDLVAIKTGGGH